MQQVTKQVTKVQDVKIFEEEFEWKIINLQREQMGEENFILSKEFRFKAIDLSW